MNILTLKSARMLVLPLALWGASGKAFAEEKIETKPPARNKNRLKDTSVNPIPKPSNQIKPNRPSVIPDVPSGIQNLEIIENPSDPPEVLYASDGLVSFPIKHGKTYFKSDDGCYFSFAIKKSQITPDLVKYYWENFSSGQVISQADLLLNYPPSNSNSNPPQSEPFQDSTVNLILRPPRKPADNSKPFRESTLASISRQELSHSEIITNVKPGNYSFTPSGASPRLVFKPEGVLPAPPLKFDFTPFRSDDIPPIATGTIPFTGDLATVQIKENSFSIPALDQNGNVYVGRGKIILVTLPGHEFPKILAPEHTPLESVQFTPYTGPLYSNNSILSLEASGDVKYPESTSVFACCVQERETASLTLDDIFLADLDSYIGDLIASNNIRKSRYGSSYITEITHQIHHGQGVRSIEQSMIKATNNIVNNPTDPDVPGFRLSPQSSVNEPEKSFDVFILTGTPNHLLVSEECRRDRQGRLTCQTITQKSEDEYLNRTFQFETKLLARVIENTYGDKCHSVIQCDNPTKKNFEAKYRKIAEDAKVNGRKVYFIYDGHGLAEENNIQAGVGNGNMQGSRSHDVYLEKFSKNGRVDENYFKTLFGEYGVEVVFVNASCHSGAALTNNEKLSVEPESGPIMMSAADLRIQRHLSMVNSNAKRTLVF